MEQELVINFSATGLIDNVMVALENHRYIDIISANISVTDLIRRQTIIEFVENFRTSYNRKDIDYIESVFSDQALIITGNVVKVKETSDNMLQTMYSEKYSTLPHLRRSISRSSSVASLATATSI
jgi:hypothetical protein